MRVIHVIDHPVARRLLPWAPFFLMLIWGWYPVHLFRELTGGGDNYEFLWVLTRLGQITSSNLADLLHYDLLFHPEGWLLTNSALTPGPYLISVPLQWVGGTAFAMNGGYLLALIATYSGSYKLARILRGSFGAAVLAALLYTFWGYRWFRVGGQLNIVFSSALLPWMIWSLEQAITSSRHRFRWIVLTSVLWAASIYGSLYFIFVGGVAIAVWIVTRIITGDLSWRQAVAGQAVIVGLSLALALPYILFFFRGTREIQSPAFSIYELNYWGGSLNSFVVPFINHPFLSKLTRAIYTGPYDESGIAAFGLLAVLVALASLLLVWRRRRWRPLVGLALIGIILTLGVTLKWNGESLQLPLLRPVNDLLWQLGRTIKPDVWPHDSTGAPFDEAIPLPGIILSAVVPFWEGARVSTRFAYIAGLGIFTAAAIAVAHVKQKWLQILLVILLLVEVLPNQLPDTAYPPRNHPAFEWLEANSAPDDGIVDVKARGPDGLAMRIGGEILLATSYHDRATASGASSILPGHTWYLKQWLEKNDEPLRADGFVELMRFYRVRFVLLHIDSDSSSTVLEQVEDNPELDFVGCFQPPEEPTAWTETICLIEILPSPFPQTNLILSGGWSGQESWGVWAEGTTSKAHWIATTQEDHRLLLEAFPNCQIDGRQEMAISINKRELITYTWPDCEPWVASIAIPAEMVVIGDNVIYFDFGHAISPAEASGGQEFDARPLSVGFSTLRIE